MIDLAKEQKRLYAALEKTGSRFFLRMDKADDALWVTDLPRWCADAQQAALVLKEEGIIWREANGLWKLDWSSAMWQEKLSCLPEEPVGLPDDEKYHPAYALCCFWLAHSAEVACGDLKPARKLLKLMTAEERRLMEAVAPMHEQAAADLRNHQENACGAGKILVCWLRGKEKET